MASSKKSVIRLTDDDYKGKSFKTAPAGKYTAKFSVKSKIKNGANGPIAEVIVTLRKDARGTAVKDINVFDNIAPHVGWKVAQVLKALGIKKTSLTLEQFIKLLKGKDVRVIIKEAKFNGKKKNEVVQYLPMNAAEGEEAEGDEDSLDDDDDEDDEDEDADEDGDEDGDEDEDGGEDEDEDDEDKDEDEAEDEDDDEDDDDDEDEGDDDEDDDDDDDDDDDEDEDEDEDEDAAPAKKSKVAPKKGKVKTAKQMVAEMNKKTKPAAAQKKTPAKKKAAPAKKKGGSRK